uniref:Secreted protein n=1 Tax=Haemonchus contortus TaxID=6289 RepID=A0A7I4YX92_HAECO
LYLPVSNRLIWPCHGEYDFPCLQLPAPTMLQQQMVYLLLLVIIYMMILTHITEAACCMGMGMPFGFGRPFGFGWGK